MPKSIHRAGRRVGLTLRGQGRETRGQGEGRVGAVGQRAPRHSTGTEPLAVSRQTEWSVALPIRAVRPWRQFLKPFLASSHP